MENCVGNIYKDKDNNLWIGIKFDDDKNITLENTCDISNTYGFPENTIYDSLDSEFRNFDNEEELLKEMTFVCGGYTFCGFNGWSYFYCNREAFKSYILNEMQKIKSFDDLYIFNNRYKDWISSLKMDSQFISIDDSNESKTIVHVEFNADKALSFLEDKNITLKIPTEK